MTESSSVGTSHQSDSGEADDFLREVAHVEDLPAPAPELRVGQSLGRFRIISELGRGGMGIVLAGVEQTHRAGFVHRDLKDARDAEQLGNGAR